MLTKILNDKKKDSFKITICTSSARDKKKKYQQPRKKKKTKSNVKSTINQITYDSCGHKIVRKLPISEQIKHTNKKPKKKTMSEKYTNYVQCPSFKMSSLRRPIDDRETENNQKSLSQELFYIREIKNKRDVPQISKLNTKLTECSSCCKYSGNYRYVPKDNYDSSKKLTSSYLNKPNNLDLNHKDFEYKSSSDRPRTRYVPCPNFLKPPDQILSTYERKNSYSHKKNLDNYSTAARIVCTNKNIESHPPQAHQESPEQDTNLNKPLPARNRDNNVLPLASVANDKPNLQNANDKYILTNINDGIPAGDKKVMQFYPRVSTRFENGVLEAFSQFKISIQCYERGQDGLKKNEAANRETQTALEQKQQSVSTDLPIYTSKETQYEGTVTQSRQTGVDDEDLNIPKNTKTFCVSCDQTDETNDELSDYYLLMPGKKCVRLAQKGYSTENFVPCPGVNDTSCDEESLSISTEASYVTHESKLVDSNTMTTPELLDCVDKMLRTHINLEESREEGIQENSSRIRDEELVEEESRCEACKSNELVDEDFKFCFEKLFKTKLSDSDCFPCLKEKLDKTGDLTKTFLHVLNYVLDLSSRAENNINDSGFKPKTTKEIIKKLCKCVKKLSEVSVINKASHEIVQPTNSQNEETRVLSKKATEKEIPISQSGNKISKTTFVTIQTETEDEPPISRSVNAIPKNVKSTKKIGTTQDPLISRSVNTIQKNGIEKQTETENRPNISRSMNTSVEEIPVEIAQTTVQNEGTNTELPNIQKEAGTSTAGKIHFQNASTQSLLMEKCIRDKFPSNNGRDPILVRVISSNDKSKTQSSDCLTSETDESKKNGYKQVCFNEHTKFLLPRRNMRCEKICIIPNKDCKKQRNFEKSHSKTKKKCQEDPKIINLENKKIFFSDFFN